MRSLRRSSRGSARRSVDHVAHVGRELRARPLDERQVLEQVGVEDAEDVGGPRREELPVLGRRAEQLADDRDGVGLAHVGHQLALALAGDLVDQLVDHRPHGGAQPVGRGRREGGRHEAAQAGVLLALHGEDGLAPPLHGTRASGSPAICGIIDRAEWNRLSRRMAVTSSSRVTRSPARCGPASAASGPPRWRPWRPRAPPRRCRGGERQLGDELWHWRLPLCICGRI